MLAAVLPFVLWGFTGPLVKVLNADPILLAILRYFFCGLFLTAASYWLIVPAFHDRRTVDWKNPILWWSAICMLTRNVFYMLSISTGPTIVVGISYSYVPLAIALISEVSALERRRPMGPMNWLSLMICFAANFVILNNLSLQPMALGSSVLFAVGAAICFAATPLMTVRLQTTGMDSLSILRGQTTIIAAISVPLIALIAATGMFDDLDTSMIGRTITVGVLVALIFTLVPFYLWYSSIRSHGAARTSSAAFVEPMTTAAISIFILQEVAFTHSLAVGFIGLLLGVSLNSFGSNIIVPIPRRLQSKPSPSAWRRLRVFGLHVAAFPFLYPLVACVILNVPWASAFQFYGSWSFNLLNAFGFLIAWCIWKSIRGARFALPFYLTGLFVESYQFVLSIRPGLNLGWAVLGGVVTVVPGLWLLLATRADRRRSVIANCKLFINGSEMPISGRLLDVSGSGCRIVTAHSGAAHLIAKRVRLRIELEETFGAHSVSGRITRIETVGGQLIFGVSFILRTRELRSRCHQFTGSLRRSPDSGNRSINSSSQRSA